MTSKKIYDLFLVKSENEPSLEEVDIHPFFKMVGWHLVPVQNLMEKPNQEEESILETAKELTY